MDMLARAPVSEFKEPDDVLVANQKKRILNAKPDVPDIRDRFYEPALLDLKVSLSPPPIEQLLILDQGEEGACTGFALAAAINLFNGRRRAAGHTKTPERVSPRMLYEMAKLHDEWPGEDYDGSSIRGVVKGFFHNGVCSSEKAPYDAREENWTLTVDQAKDARNTGLGAYYRLRPEIIDYHAALNETGVIIASARVHRGWTNPAKGVIKKSNLHEGGHAFAIVGYDAEGFLIQNSWGEDWGGFKKQPGIAHWRYEDWAENIIDAWVLRLSVPTPEAFDLTHTPIRQEGPNSAAPAKLPEPRRADVIGHVIHLDDGKLVAKGRYGTPLKSIEETANFLLEDAGAAKRKYDHILFYAHGGLNSAMASARRISAMREVFKRNRIYPIHFMWETGVTEEFADILRSMFTKSEERVGGIRDALDWMIEKTTRGLGTKIWREIKGDGERAFANAKSGGMVAVKTITGINAGLTKPFNIHLVGHSAGSILLAECLAKWQKLAPKNTKISTCSLMAPACTLEYFESRYLPHLKSGLVDRLVQYNLIDSREQDDTVGPYGKSLLYLVSRAFEEEQSMPILGMETFLEGFKPSKQHTIHYAGRKPVVTDSKTHGGFDNDRATMNHILKSVLGKAPSAKNGFQEEELHGY